VHALPFILYNQKYNYPMMMTKKRFLIPILVSTILASCVSSQKFEELSKQNDDCNKERTTLKIDNQKLSALLQDEKSRNEQLVEDIKFLKTDSAARGKRYRKLADDYATLEKHHDELEQLAEKKITNSRGETRTALEELNLKENTLRKLEDSLSKQRRALDYLGNQLQEREARVAELEKYIKDQKDAVNKLKERIAAAMKGFIDGGLNVTERNGKVYVSMEEKLLFESGKTEVSENGRKALDELAKVLEKEKQLEINIEGHTDNVPLAGTGFMKDNWDLSVLRATSIARILLNNKGITPERIITSGRGEYLPVGSNETKEGKAKNRRTEIIITPKLSEIFEILKSN
jgi:chemotaxis protein MotB